MFMFLVFYNWVKFYCFVCLRPVSCVPNVASVYVLCFIVLFVFVLCLVCTMLPVSMCCVLLFCLSSSCVLCAHCCQCLCVVFYCFVCLRPVSCVHNVASVSVLCFIVLFVFVLCLVYPMLPVSLDCPFFIAPLVFSNVYWMRRFYIIIINSLTVSVRDDDYSWHVSCTLN
jgi:hypothetical protein